MEWIETQSKDIGMIRNVKTFAEIRKKPIDVVNKSYNKNILRKLSKYKRAAESKEEDSSNFVSEEEIDKISKRRFERVKKREEKHEKRMEMQKKKQELLLNENNQPEFCGNSIKFFSGPSRNMIVCRSDLKRIFTIGKGMGLAVEGSKEFVEKVVEEGRNKYMRYYNKHNRQIISMTDMENHLCKKFSISKKFLQSS